MRSLGPEDEAESAAALALAFRDNPLTVAVLGPDPGRRLRANRAGMAVQVVNVRRYGVALVARAAQGLGVLLAGPPDSYPLPPPPWRDQLRHLWTQGPRASLRWQRVFEHMQRRHPLPPHWYLATLGVHPAAQGRGIGRALLRELLRRADADDLESYLETDREQNLPFYERAGFRTLGESRIFGTRIWHLQRPRLSDRGAGS